jgi:hypothetical protein
MNKKYNCDEYQYEMENVSDPGTLFLQEFSKDNLKDNYMSSHIIEYTHFHFEQNPNRRQNRVQQEGHSFSQHFSVFCTSSSMGSILHMIRSSSSCTSFDSAMEDRAEIGEILIA